MCVPMSFFLPNRLDCPICARTIVARLDAARLFYAHLDDVGDIARYGRAWVHRKCWNTWSIREAWAQSAARLLTQHEGETVSNGLAVCHLGERDVLLQDTWHAIEASIPSDRLKELCASLETTTLSQFRLKGLLWTFVAGEHGLEVTIEDATERFEMFSLEPGPWKNALEQLLLLQAH
jgi:hypothetical protein